jgi:hypothetical protein
VFGVSLEEILQKDPSRSVPRIVERLVQYLEEHEVFETEGIFRKSGRNLAIDALRKEFDFAGQGKEDEVNLANDENVGIHEVRHVVVVATRGVGAYQPLTRQFSSPRFCSLEQIAGTLKLFLQMLPEPPLSYELYPSYIALQGTDSCARTHARVSAWHSR